MAYAFFVANKAV